jgi:uncharacterized iron-regulated membrane protein
VRLVGPRSSWRRAHFWLGVTATIYIVFVGVTGSAIVFEQGLYRFLLPDPPLSATTGASLDDGALKSAIAFQFPNSIVIGLWDRRLTDGMAVEVWLDGSNGTLRRLIHPTTGEDLGDAHPVALRLLAFLRRAHIAALAGSSGQIMNATGALMLIALSISGLAARRHSSAISGRKKSALTFHRIAGTIGSFFGILWGVTGACLVFPTTFVGVLGAANEPLFDWMYVLHTGSAGGLTTRILWASAGLALVLAAVTGARLWWRRTRINARSPSERGNSLPAPRWGYKRSITSALRRHRHPTTAVFDPGSRSCGPPPRTVPPSRDSPSP